MKKMLQTLRYLAKSFSTGIVSGFIIILGTVAVTDLVFFLTSLYSMADQDISATVLTVPFEVSAGIFALLIGLVLFITNFKVALVNGVSRKTFLLANLPAAGIAAAAFSIFNLVVIKVHGLFWPIISISDLYYPRIGCAGFLIFQFALYFLLIMTGRFIILAYYRSNTLVKWAISIAPFALFGLLQVANARSGGTIFAAIKEYQRMSMRMDRAPFTLLAYSAILCGLVYLLIRRVPLKD